MMTSRTLGVMLVLTVMTTHTNAQQGPAPPESATVASAYALIAPDFTGMPVRLDVRQESEALVLKVTRANLAAETARRRTPVPNGLEARVTQTASGEVASITITGEVAAKTRVRVQAAAPEATRRTALRSARFGQAKASDVQTYAATRAVRALGMAGTAGTPTLVWDSIGTEERPVWEVPLQVEQKTGTARYVARFDPVDGSLLSIAREVGR